MSGRNQAQAGSSPVSFRASVRRLPADGMPLRIEADADERAALAEAHGLISVDRFEADMLVRDWKRGGVRVTGSVVADVVQACVVSLEPVAGRIDEEIDALFAPEGSKLTRPTMDSGGEMLLSAEGPDAPETFAGDTIDVGALAEEIFALAIDPYPHAAGAAALPAPAEAEEDAARDSPFARLKGLTDDRARKG